MAYVSLAEVMLYIGNIEEIDEESTLPTDALEEMILSAQAFVDTYCNQTFEASTDTTRTFYVRDIEHGGSVYGLTLVFDAPLYQITSITNGNDVIVAPSDYILEPRNYGPPYHEVRLKSTSGLFWEWGADDYEDSVVSVVGRWAYSLTPPQNIKQAMYRLTHWLYKQRENTPETDRAVQVGDLLLFPAVLPKDIIDLLAPYQRRNVGI